MSVDLRDADRILAFAAQRFEQRVERRGSHGGNRDEERELQSSGARHANELSACNGRHGPRGSGEDGGEDLAQADPDRLSEAHVFHLPGVDAAVRRLRDLLLLIWR